MAKLGRLKLVNPFILAPMAMYSDAAFVKLCYEYGCSYAFTELIPTAAFVRKLSHIIPKMDFKGDFGIQFVSNNPGELKEAIQMVNDSEFYPNMAKIKSIDLNLGCPKIGTMRHNLGSALLNKPELVKELFSVMKKYSKFPVSAKIRLALTENHKKKKPYLEIAKIAKAEGLDFITIHGRTTEQQYSGEVDVLAIAEIASKVDIPVVGNGNIVSVETATNMLSFCSGVMIGRHSLKDPFIFKQLDYQINKKREWKFDYKKEKIKCIEKYLSYAEKLDISPLRVKTHVQHMLKGLIGQKDTIRLANKCKSVAELKELVI